jgi:hypothetical protein
LCILTSDPHSFFFLAPATIYPQVLTAAQQAKAIAARAMAMPLALARACFMKRRVQPFISFPTPFSVLAAPLAGAAEEEGQGAVNALDMDHCSCSCCDSFVLEEDFGRAHTAWPSSKNS